MGWFATLIASSACEGPQFNDPAQQRAAEGETPAAHGTWDMSQPFPGAGLYDGVSSTPSAGQVCSGSAIAGITGSAVCQGASGGTNATAANVLAGTYFWAEDGASVAGTMPLGADVTGADGAASVTLPAGYYDGTRTVTVTDSDLVASKIVGATTIFGVTGSAVCIADTTGPVASSTQILSGTVAWDNTGAKITGAMADHGAWDLRTAFAGAGYYSAVSNTPSASSICADSTILGVTGSFDCAASTVLASHQHRDKTTTQLTAHEEATTAAGTPYTNSDPGYRAVPRIQEDDEGSEGASVTLVSRAGWDTTCDSGTGALGGSSNSVCTCGLSGTIAQRIADCAAHGLIGINATWNGATRGNAGQSVWQLVTRSAAVNGNKGREVWKDTRTGLLWSSLLSTGINWCKATGSNFITGNPTAEDDPADYCDTAAHQNTGTAPADKAVSACFEDDGTYFTTAGTDQDGKGGLGRGSTPAVGWRVPSRSDYSQADADGIRFVMPDMTSFSIFEWTTTSESYSGRAGAWVFSSSTGRVSSAVRTTATYGVRCVGR